MIQTNLIATKVADSITNPIIRIFFFFFSNFQLFFDLDHIVTPL